VITCVILFFTKDVKYNRQIISIHGNTYGFYGTAMFLQHKGSANKHCGKQQVVFIEFKRFD
jgi:hypothetical protein